MTRFHFHAARVKTAAIFDDHHAVRDMLRASLVRHGGYEIVGEGGTGREAVDICLQARPEIVILDVVLPILNGIEVLEQLRQKVRGLKVVFFSACLQEHLVCRAISLGASAYVSKTTSLLSLLAAVDSVSTGGTFFDPRIAHLAERLATDRSWETLSRREREVLRLIAEGRSTKEAAALLKISVKTLEKHRYHMMNKLRLHDAVAVTRYAIQAGLITLV